MHELTIELRLAGGILPHLGNTLLSVDLRQDLVSNTKFCTIRGNKAAISSQSINSGGGILKLPPNLRKVNNESNLEDFR